MRKNKIYVFEMQVAIFLPGIREMQERIVEDIATEEALEDLEQALKEFFVRKTGNKLDVMVNIPVEG